MNTKIEKTTEQKEIISTYLEGEDIIVEAFAGCTKSFTCQAIARAKATEVLYLAFNTSIRQEAKLVFPEWATCHTIHSLAWGYIVRGTAYKNKLGGFLLNQEIKTSLKDFLVDLDSETIYFTCANVVELVEMFCRSASFDISLFISDYILDRPEYTEDFNWVALGEKLWTDLINKKNPIKITHDIYLKLFQLSKPDLSKEYKVILLDEMQDSNPVTLDIFYRQQGKVQLIGVGDDFQAIYAWRGADKAMKNIPETFTKKSLTWNFRFNQDLADQANIILNYMGATKGITGKGTQTEINSKAVLVRNNSTLFNYLLQAATNNQKVFAIAELKELFNQMYTANSLLYCKKGEKPKFGPFPHKKIASYSSWKELCSDKSPDIQKIAKLVSNCQPTVHEAITKAKSCLVDSEELADLTIVTGHKSKGREWDEITLTNDFLPYVSEEETMEEKLEEFIKGQGMNLAYVAITRARVKVNLTPEWEYFLNLLKTI